MCMVMMLFNDLDRVHDRSMCTDSQQSRALVP